MVQDRSRWIHQWTMGFRQVDRRWQQMVLNYSRWTCFRAILGSLRDCRSSFYRPPPILPGIQVNVKNGGADQPSSSELTTLPGMYNEYEWPNIYTDDLDGFVVAGPKLVSFADSSSSDPSPPSSTSPSSSTSSLYSHSPSPTVTPIYSMSPPANPTSTCRTRKNASKKRSFSVRHVHRRSLNH